MALNIITCEDNKIISLDLTRHLQSLNHKVILSCSRGEEVLDHLSKGVEADLIITDVKLQGNLDGYQLASEVLKLYGVYIVFITGAASDEFKKYFLTNKKTCFIKKPFDEEVLQSAIQKFQSLNRNQ